MKKKVKIKINMRKFGWWLVKDHIDGKIIDIGPNFVRVHGVGVDDWHPCGVNRTYTRKDALETYFLLSKKERRKVDWVKKV